MSNNTVNKLASKIIISGMVITFVALLVLSTYLDFELKLHHSFTTAQVIEVREHHQGGITIRYDYHVGDVSHNSSDTYYFSSEHMKLFENQKVPLMYLPYCQGHCKLMIFKEDFTEIGLEFPDSLKWTDQIELE